MAEQERGIISPKTTAVISALLPVFVAAAARIARGMKERKRRQDTTSASRTRGTKSAASLTDCTSGQGAAFHEIETILSVQCETGYTEVREKIDL